MSRPVTWSNLTKGLITLVVIAALAVAVLLFARIGALHGKKTTLYMVTNAASGVIDGTEVWLGGQKVGLVRTVQLAPVTNDTSERVLIVMDILSQYVHNIRKNSDVQIRPGTSLIGAPVVYITVGSASFPPVASNDTLRARAQISGRHGFVSDISVLGDSIVTVANTMKQIAAQIDTTGGEIIQLRKRTERQASEVGRAINRYTQGTTQSHGSIALLSSDTALHHQIHRVIAQADSIRTAVHGAHGNVGRFRRDSTLIPNAEAVLATADTLRQRLTSFTTAPNGNDTLARQLDRVHLQLDSLVTDAKHHPFQDLSLGWKP
jgi:ABC-type transporter Mla subunit MlaD